MIGFHECSVPILHPPPGCSPPTIILKYIPLIPFSPWYAQFCGLVSKFCCLWPFAFPHYVSLFLYIHIGEIICIYPSSSDCIPPQHNDFQPHLCITNSHDFFLYSSKILLFIYTTVSLPTYLLLNTWVRIFFLFKLFCFGDTPNFTEGLPLALSSERRDYF